MDHGRHGHGPGEFKRGIFGVPIDMNLATHAIFDGPGQPLRMGTSELPTPGPGHVLVRIRLATICGSDLHTVEGRREAPCPCILGHEAVGDVEAVGPGRDPAWLGKRVTWTLADSCGACRPCTEWGLPQKCERLFKYGHASMKGSGALSGCYSTHILLRPGTTLCEVPEGVPDAMAAPANCALATAIAVVESVPGPGRHAVVQGGGMVGCLVVALLREAGWERVTVVEPLPARHEFAARCGGIAVLPTQALDLTAGTADAVVETAGVASVIGEGIRLLRPGGHYAWAGMVHPASRVDMTGEQVIRKCLTIRGTHNYGPRHLHAAMGFLQRHGRRLGLDAVVSTPFGLHDLGAAIEVARSGAHARVAIVPG
jgi:putative phosphonate catabolism associated alcohol dehydrogenase